VVPDGREGAFNGVRRSQVLPVLGWEVVERQQRIAVLGQAIGSSLVFELVGVPAVGRRVSRDRLGIDNSKGRARGPDRQSGVAALSKIRSAQISKRRSTSRFVFVERLALFERVAGKRPRLRRGYTVLPKFSNDRLFSSLHAIAKLYHIKTSGSGLGKDSL
jgi:hypothetical protein